MIRKLVENKFIILTAVTLLVTALDEMPAFGGETIKRIRARGVLRCGVSEGIPGFSEKDAGGRWQGLEVEFCRAVAAAAIGDAGKVRFRPLRASERFPALKGGLVDLLLSNTTWTMGREAGLKVKFPVILFYDGQGFMVDNNAALNSTADLEGKTICMEKGTTHVDRIADLFAGRNQRYTPFIVDSLTEALPLLRDGQCQAVTGDLSTLHALRLKASEGPRAFRLLPERISREPLCPVVRDDDAQWETLVRWVLFLLVAAEEKGITQDNVLKKVSDRADAEVTRALDACRAFARPLGIASDWAVRVIAGVGNYGEIFERTLGRQSPFKMDRGLNRLWNEGGLMFAPPLQ